MSLCSKHIYQPDPFCGACYAGIVDCECGGKRPTCSQCGGKSWYEGNGKPKYEKLAEK